MKKGFIIAIDGPLASGKGTIAKKLARAVHGVDLYTGAMYRCLALFCINSGINLADASDVIVQLNKITVMYTQGRIRLNDADVTDAIADSAIAEGASVVAIIPEVRKELVKRQQHIGIKEVQQGNIVVVEGRDIGTVVFPQAACKIYLTASVKERAKRRLAQLRKLQSNVTLEEVLQQITARDSRDTTRTHDPLPSEPEKLGYFILDNSEMNEDQTIAAILSELKRRKLYD